MIFTHILVLRETSANTCLHIWKHWRTDQSIGVEALFFSSWSSTLYELSRHASEPPGNVPSSHSSEATRWVDVTSSSLCEHPTPMLQWENHSHRALCRGHFEVKFRSPSLSACLPKATSERKAILMDCCLCKKALRDALRLRAHPNELLPQSIVLVP